MTAELPGLKKEDVDVQITRDGVEIKAATGWKQDERAKNYVRKERGSRSVYRMIRLPEEVKTDVAEASLKNGILEVVLPKKAPKAKKKLTVKWENHAPSTFQQVQCYKMIRLKRVYEAPSWDDGYRILVDKLWPRGLSKDKALVDLWLKEVAPSTNLRKWFFHDPEKWEKFKKKYLAELRSKEDILDKIRQAERERGTVTLVYAAKDEKLNDAVVLLSALRNVKGNVGRG